MIKKNSCLLLTLSVSCTIAGMDFTPNMDLRSPSRLKQVSDSLKELQYEAQQHPVFYSAAGLFYAAATVVAWKIHPLACAGLHTVTTYPSALLMAYIVPQEAQQRKIRYKNLTFYAIKQGNFNLVAKYAAKNHYEETDLCSLKEQNTEFLFKTLYEYSECCQLPEANNYSEAARIFIAHHADREKVLECYRKNCYQPQALKWLEEEPISGKQKQ